MTNKFTTTFGNISTHPIHMYRVYVHVCQFYIYIHIYVYQVFSTALEETKEKKLPL